jgi:putative phosphoribosyl transferase
VAARSVCTQLSHEAEQVVCLSTPPDLDAVGRWYDDFTQTTDAEVCELLARSFRD